MLRGLRQLQVVAKKQLQAMKQIAPDCQAKKLKQLYAFYQKERNRNQDLVREYSRLKIEYKLLQRREKDLRSNTGGRDSKSTS